jgi:glycosyltransferase involved in cell wall biosynthesis
MLKKLLIEGWLFLPHSYSCINMWQCLELLKRKDLNLYHNDMPYFNGSWNPTADLISLEADEKLQGLPFLPAEIPDITLRMDFPLRLDKAESPALFVFGTSESLHAEHLIKGEGNLGELLAESGAIILTPSQWSAQGFINSGADPSLVKIIPLGADTGFFQPVPPEKKQELRKSLGFGNTFVFLNISAMTENKGTAYLLKAFAGVAENFPDTMLCLKGNDDLYNSSQLLKFAGGFLNEKDISLLTPRVRYYGATFTSRMLAKLYQAADAYVSPYMAEGFNLPVLEAAASGLPVICTAGGPTDEFTEPSFALKINSKTGVRGKDTYLIPDINHLVSLMISVITDKKVSESARNNGPRFVQNCYTWQHYTDRLLGVLLNGVSP